MSAFNHDLKRDLPPLPCAPLRSVPLLHTPSSQENSLHCLTPFPHLLFTPQPTPICSAHTPFPGNALCQVTSTSLRGPDPCLPFWWWLCGVLATLCHTSSQASTKPPSLGFSPSLETLIFLILFHPLPESWDYLRCGSNLTLYLGLGEKGLVLSLCLCCKPLGPQGELCRSPLLELLSHA